MLAILLLLIKFKFNMRFKTKFRIMVKVKVKWTHNQVTKSITRTIEIVSSSLLALDLVKLISIWRIVIVRLRMYSKNDLKRGSRNTRGKLVWLALLFLSLSWYLSSWFFFTRFSTLKRRLPLNLRSNLIHVSKLQLPIFSKSRRFWEIS